MSAIVSTSISGAQAMVPPPVIIKWYINDKAWEGTTVHVDEPYMWCIAAWGIH